MNNFTIQNIEQLPNKYNLNDVSLLGNISINNEFTYNDILELHILSNNDIIKSVYDNKNYKLINNQNNNISFNNIELNPLADLENNNLFSGKYSLIYNFYRKLFNSNNNNKFYIKEISLDRTEIKISSLNIPPDIIKEDYIKYISNRNIRNYYSDMILNFGNNKTFIGVNILFDDNYNDIFIKLYEPLSININIKDTLWITEQISDSLLYNVENNIIITNESNIFNIKGPNFDLSVNQQNNTLTPYLNLFSLTNNISSSVLNQIHSLKQDNIDINIDYNNYENFIHFSSLEKRIENFYYKLTQIQKIDEDINILNNIPSSSLENSIINLEKQKDILLKSFDKYEYFLYYESGSNSFPKINNFKPYINYNVTSSQSLIWMGSTNIQNSYYGGKLLESYNYDVNNRDYIWNNLPEYIRLDDQNEQLNIFISLLGHHFDDIWCYIKDITNKNNNDNRINYGISKDLVLDTLKSFGINLYTNSRTNNNIYQSLLGINNDSSTFITSSTTIPENDIIKETYKRIYNNLPFILKSKGTSKGLYSLLNCFGIPRTILNIKEFGNNNDNNYSNETEEFNYSINVSNNSYIDIPFYPSYKQFLKTGFNDIFPDSIEFRFKLENIIPTQSLLSSINNDKFIKIEHTTGSLGKIYFGLVDNLSPIISSPIELPFYNNDWWNICINKITGSLRESIIDINQEYELLIGNKDITGSISLYSSSIYITSSDNYNYNQPLNSPDRLILGKDSSSLSNPTSSYSGNFQEFRYWINELGKDDFIKHIQNPKSFEYINETGSYENLIFRISLGSELDRTTTGSIFSINIPDIESFIYNNISSSEAYIINNSIYNENYERYYTNNFHEFNNNIIITKEENIGDNVLSINSSIIKNKNKSKLTNNIEIGISPQNIINDDIIKQIGSFDINQYLGDPLDINYNKLKSLNKFYFQKYYNNNNNISNIIKLLSYLDNSLFKMIKDFIPSKGNLSSGLIIKSHILERNKISPPLFNLNLLEQQTEIKIANISGNNPLDYYVNTYNTYNTPSKLGLINVISNDGKELFNGNYSGSNINIIQKSNNIVFENNRINIFNENNNFNQLITVLNPIQYIENIRLSNNYYKISTSPLLLNSLINEGDGKKLFYSETQNSNYTLKRHIIPRYVGSKQYSKLINKYSEGDISYGNSPVINDNINKIIYFEEITSQSLTLPERSNIYIKYLIDEDSNITELTRQNKNIFDIQSIFNNKKIDILLNNNQYPSQQKILDGLNDIYIGGFRYEPILQNITNILSTHNNLEYTLNNDIEIQNISSSNITSDLPVSSISINNFSLETPPSLTPGTINTPANTINTFINSRVLVNVNRNTSYPGEIIQRVTGSISFNIKIAPPSLNTKFYRNNNFTGVEYILEPGIYDSVSEFPGFNDNVRSIKVPGGIKANIYQHINRTGLINSYTGPINTNISIPFGVSGVSSVELLIQNLSASLNIYNQLNNFGEIPSSNISNGLYNIEYDNNLNIILTYPIEGLIILPEGTTTGNILLRDINNNIGNIRAIINLHSFSNQIQLSEIPEINYSEMVRSGLPYIFTSPPDYIYISSSIEYGFNSGSAPTNNWYFERGNSSTSGSFFNLLTGSYYLSDLIYNYYNNGFIQTYPTFSQLGYENIDTNFQLNIGDIIKFYNIDKKSFPINFENEIKDIILPQSQPSTSSYDNRLVIKLKDEVPNKACLDYNESGSLSKKIQNFIILSKIQDETNIIIKKNKKTGQTSPGILIPDNISSQFKEKAGNIIKNLKNQNLI